MSEAEKQFAASPARTTGDRRLQPRFKLEVDIRVYSRTRGMLKGRTVDISESGIGAMIIGEPPLSEIVELNFILPSGPVRILATVRQKSAFRYGFAFVDAASVLEVIRRKCRDLAMEQSVFGGREPNRSQSARMSAAAG